MMMAATVDTDPGDETLAPFDVLAWRYERLVAAGYDVEIALLLAERATVDLHRACELLERGATVEEAVRILT